MFKALFGIGYRDERARLQAEYTVAMRLLSRAMKNHGVNSKEAVYYSRKADDLEAALAAI